MSDYRAESKPYESVKSLLRQIFSILDQCMELEEMYRFLLCKFCFELLACRSAAGRPLRGHRWSTGFRKFTLLQVLKNALPSVHTDCGYQLCRVLSRLRSAHPDPLDR